MFSRRCAFPVPKRVASCVSAAAGKRTRRIGMHSWKAFAPLQRSLKRPCANGASQECPLSFKPLVTMPCHELVIRQVRISAAHAIDFGGLSGAEHLIRVQAPRA